MTSNTKTTKKNTTTPKVAGKKEALFKLVEESDIKKPLLMGILVRAGLYRQYLEEIEKKDEEVIPATITKSEFKQIIQKYKGA